MSSAFLLFPDFCLILLGYVIRRKMHLGDHFWTGVEKLVYFIFFPALLVNALLKTHIDLVAAAPLLIVALLCMVGAMVLALGLRWLLNVPPHPFASVFQCAFRFNSYVGLAAAGMLFGQEGIATMGMILGVTVPLANLSAVSMLARHGNFGLWKEIAKNPLIWATFSGLVLNLMGFTAPAPIQAFMGRLADASIALGLLTVGAALRFQMASQREMTTAIGICLIKLLAMPCLAVFLAQQFGLQGLHYAMAVVFTALPTASSAYILAMRMGGDGPSVARLVSMSTIGAMFTLPLWAAWLQG